MSPSIASNNLCTRSACMHRLVCHESYKNYAGFMQIYPSLFRITFSSLAARKAKLILNVKSININDALITMPKVYHMM